MSRKTTRSRLIAVAMIFSLLTTAFAPFAYAYPSKEDRLPELAEETNETVPPPASPDPRNTESKSPQTRAPLASAFIDNGIVQLGVRDTGDLNVPGGPASIGGTTTVGLRYLPSNAEATAAGCTCEGWGLGDSNTGIWGGANTASGGVNNLTVNSFSSTTNSAISDVNVGSTFRVIHDFHPSPDSPLLYEVIVTIQNISGAPVDPIYRRAMDWDIEPTPFNEYVTIQASAGMLNLLFSSDNGFADSNVFNSPGQIMFTGTAVDSGPADHGAVFDFGFTPLDPGETISFRIFYGAGSNETDAMNALSTVAAQVYSLGQTSTDPTGGTPNTFVFGFGGLGGTIGDYIWEDANQDGIQNAGETGINGTLVNLYLDNGDGVADPSTDFYQDTIASYNNGVADGYYEFPNLLSADYFLEFVLPNGYTFSAQDQGGDDNLDSDANPSTGLTEVFFVEVATDDFSRDAGLYGTPTALVSDFIWHDGNRNGLQDPVEAGINGIAVTLYQDNGDNVANPATDYFIDTTTSYNNGADGHYEFPYLAEANYFIVFDLPSNYISTVQNAGSDDNLDSDANVTTGYTDIFFLPDATVNTTIDAGYIRVYSIGNFTWMDINGNGIQDAGENGRSSVPVNLYADDGDNTPEPGGDDGAPIQTTISDVSGAYAFTKVLTGTYFVEFSLPTGYVFSPKDQGSNDTLDSDPDPSTGLTSVFTLSTDNFTRDAGMSPLPIIVNSSGDTIDADACSSLTFADLPGPDGVTTLREAICAANSIAGLDLILFDPSLAGIPIVLTTTGAFEDFNNTGDLDIRDDLIIQGLGTTDTIIDGASSDRVFHLPFIFGIEVSLNDLTITNGNTTIFGDRGGGIYNRDGSLILNNVLMENNLGWQGAAIFTCCNGTSSLALNNSTLQLNTSQSHGSALYINGSSTTINATNILTNTIDSGYGAGIFNVSGATTIINNSSISGNKANNGGGGGIYNDADLTLTNSTLSVNTATGASGGAIYQGGAMTLNNVTITKNNHSFNAGGLAAFGFTQVKNTIIAGNTVGGTNPNDCNGSFSSQGGNVVGNGTGCTVGGGDTTIVPANVFTDMLSSTLALNDGSTYNHALLDFPGINPAQDFITDCTTVNGNPVPNDQRGIIRPGGFACDSGAYEIPTPLGDFVWQDLNGNGLQDSGEPGLNGVAVNLYADDGDNTPEPGGDDGSPLESTVTYNDEGFDGYYQFNSALGGANYFVEYVLPTGYNFSSQDQGGDDTLDSDPDPITGLTSVFTFSPIDSLDHDAGLTDGTASRVGNYVWNDVNANGLQGSEPGVNGMVVNLYQDNGDNLSNPATDALIDTTVTFNNSSNGYYDFTNLAAGNYFVEFVLNSSYIFTVQDAGSDTTDSDANPSTGRTDVFALSANTFDNTRDAGILPVYEVGNFAWLDVDGDGIQDAGEPGRSGVIVRLYTDDGDNTPEPGGDDGNPVATDLTDANGTYNFPTNLNGKYFLAFDLPTGYIFSPQDQGGNDSLDSEVDPDTALTAVFTLGADDFTRDAGMSPLPIIVDSPADTIDANACSSLTFADLPGPDDVTTLREAICAANNNPGLDIILFDSSLAGTPIVLTQTGMWDDFNNTGDLDIRDDLIIQGLGTSQTIVDGNETDRVFHIPWVGNIDVSLNDMTIQNGNMFNNDNGGGIYNGDANLTLNSVHLENNRSRAGGAIFSCCNSLSTLTLNRTTIQNNEANYEGGGVFADVNSIVLNETNILTNTSGLNCCGYGGGMFLGGGSSHTANITQSSISGNTANNGGGGGIYSNMMLVLTNSTVSGNNATGDGGGGIMTWGMLTLNHTTITQNTAPWGGGVQGGGTNTFKNVIIAGNTNSGSIPDDCSLGFTSQGGNVFGNGTGCSAGGGDTTINPANVFTDMLDANLTLNGGTTYNHALLDLPGTNPVQDFVIDCTTVAGSSVISDQRGMTRPQGTACDSGAYEVYVLVTNQPPTATDNTYTTDENTALTGNVLTDNTGDGVDSDPDNDTFALTEVNGSSANVGTPIILSSGATLTVNSDGSFTYDPTTSATFNNLAPSQTAQDTFTYTIDDFVTGTDSATVTITITGLNDAPAITNLVLDNGTINENGNVQLGGTFTDPESGDFHTILITWGDGLTDTLNLATGVFSFNASHQYLDDDPSGTSSDSLPISFTVSDSTASDSASSSVTVNNVAPALSNVSAPAIDENGLATLSGDLTDAGTLDTFELVVNWGDGSAPETFNYASGTTSFSETHQYLDDNPTGTLSDSYTISLTLSDDDTGSSTASTTLTVNNVAPSVNAGGDQTATNGTTVNFSGSFTDPGTLDTHTILWDFGDSTTATGTLTPTHTFPAAGVYTVTLTVTDDDTGAGSDSLVVTITDTADLGITKADNADPVQLGATLVYTLTITNYGPNSAQNVVVTDTLPSEVTWVSDSCMAEPPVSGQWIWNAGMLVSGSQTCLVTVTVTSAGSGVITNTVIVSSDTTDLVPGNNNALETTVVNTPPQLGSLTLTSPVNENGMATLSGTISDPDAEIFTLVVDWGDGTVMTYTYSASTTTFTESHTYLDDAPTATPSDNYTVALTLSDGNGGSASTNAGLTVNNVAPTLSNVELTSSVSENGTTALSGIITDPGMLDAFTLVVDWGDGSAPQTFLYSAGTTTFSETHLYLDDNPSGTGSDSYTVSLTLSDDDTGSDTASASLTVNNVAPALSNVSLTSSLNENETATLSAIITDPGTLDTFEVVVDWGNGISDTIVLPAGTTFFSNTHTYMDDDPSGTTSDTYPVTITLTDDDTGFDTASSAVTVNNIAPALSNLSALAIDENGTATLSGNISDTGPQDPFTLIVDWGDGSALETFNYSAGTTTFSETHQYTDDNPTGTSSDSYTISLTLSDDDMGTDTDTVSITVNNVTPSVNAGGDQSVSNGVAVNFSGSFTDAGTLDTHTILWDFGDGNSASGTLTPSHTFPGTGVYTVTLTVSDDDMGAGSDTLVVTVTDSTDLDITKTDSVDPVQLGATLSYTLTVTNYGPNTAQNVVVTDTLPAEVSWLSDSCFAGAPFGNQWVWNIGSLAPGSITCLVTVTVNSAGSGTITNTVTVSSSTTEMVPGNNSDLETTTVNTAPQFGSLTLTTPVDENGTVTLSGTISDPDDGGSFTLTVDWADGSVITYTYPAGTTAFTETHTYLDDDPTATPSDNYTVILNLSDDSGGAYGTTAGVTVNNVAPALSNVSLSSFVNENGVTTLSGNLGDPGTLDTFTLVVDWGDGSASETFTYPTGTTTFTETHTYLDDNPTATASDNYTVTLTLTDDDTGTDTSTANVTVSNVAPTISNVNLTSTNENGTATLSGDIADLSTFDTFTLLVDWGDGSASETFTYPAGTTIFTETHTYLDDDPSATSSDIYTMSLTLTDDDTGTDSDTANTTISNVAPILSNLAVSPINENEATTLSGDITDAGTLDTFELMVSWGDGTVMTYTYPAGTTAFTETHSYSDGLLIPLDATYTITLALEDDDTGTDTDEIVLSVANVPPTITSMASTSPVNENDSTTLMGTFTDPGTLDTFTVLVDWGDGSVLTATYPAGSFDFLHTHQYMDDDPTATSSDVYTVTVTLLDDEGGADTATTTLTVNNVAPTVDAGADQSITDGNLITFDGSFTDPGTLDTHSILWDFGDGNTATSALTPSHTFAAAGVYTVTLTMTDDDTGTNSDTLLVTVESSTDLSLMMTESEDPVLAGASLDYQLTITNSGPSDASNVVVIDTLPDGVTFSSASAGCSESIGVVTCNLGNLASGTTVSVNISTVVDTTTEGIITNSAQVTGDDTDPITTNNFATEVTEVLVSVTVFEEDFEEPPLGSEWTCGNSHTSTTPSGRNFLGEFGAETICLSLTDLPNHNVVTIAFDLYVIRSWDGNQIESVSGMPGYNFHAPDTEIGPDRWQFEAEGITLLDTTFSNWESFTQSYPGQFPDSSYAAWAGAIEVNTLGYDYIGIQKDSVYHIELTFDHTGDSLDMEFIGMILQDLLDESWGIDNVIVIVDAGGNLQPVYTIFLPVIKK